MSDVDIDAGARGINEVFQQLETATVGVIVVTEENKNSPWLLFESGALSKQLCDKARVCPYLVGSMNGHLQTASGIPGRNSR